MTTILESYIDHKVAVITQDGRFFVGTLTSFDQAVNIVLGQCQERVFCEEAGVECVNLGLYMIRGDSVVVIGEIDEDIDKTLDFPNIVAPPFPPTDEESVARVDRMVQVILDEAYEESQKIEKLADEEANIHKLKLIEKGKLQISEEVEAIYRQKLKLSAVKNSDIKNKKKLNHLFCQYKIIEEVQERALGLLEDLSKRTDEYQKLCTQLIFQAMKLLNESEYTIRVRKEDLDIIKPCLEDAQKLYLKYTNDTSNLVLKIDTKQYLPPGLKKSENTKDNNMPPACVGGVMILSQNGKITVDNTFDTRIKLAVEKYMPYIQKQLFNNMVEK